MEAAAIGVANTALNSVVKTAITTITNEIGLLLGVQEELFFIKEEREMMQGFLQAASTEKENGVVVTIWVKQVRELAFDVEDCLQDASIHLMKKSCLPIMCSVKKRDHIAKKIRMLKTRIEDVSKRNLRYELIKGNGGHTSDESASNRSIDNVKALLVGLEEPKRKLVELTLKKHVEPTYDPWYGKVVSVVGMGGLGKTTLVKEVYDCQELRNEFNQGRIYWVTVQHPFNKEEFIESLAKQIPSNFQEVDNEGDKKEGNKKGIKKMPEELSKKTIKESWEKIKEYLKDKKYLIVLDDLSSLTEWEVIKKVLPTGNEVRIIVTTRYRSPLAESISQLSDIYEIKELSETDAVDLFCKAVYKTSNYCFVSDEGSKVQKQCITNTITEKEDREIKEDPPHENKCNIKNGSSSTEIKEENSEMQKQSITNIITEGMKTKAGLIIESCGRLPLAIVTIGSYLATKQKNSAEWKAMHDHLSSELANNRDLGVVNTVLTSSYDGMPYHLKPSLLYLCVFHNHKEIRRSRIIRRWMADGYVMEDRIKTTEEVEKAYLYDLMGRSLIQPSQTSTIVNGNVKRCNIHDMMYELILRKAVDESMVSVLQDGKLISMTDKVRHLVITGGPCTGSKVLERVKLSHMRSLSIFGDVGDYLRYPKMKLVRVLDLEDTLNLSDRDLRSVGQLRHLKYLGLRGTKIEKLPDSLGKLIELETLDIRNTWIYKLPTGLTKLHKLSYLRAGFEISKNSVGVSVPRGIGELRSLNILGMIRIGGRKSLTKEMQNLTNLRKLAVTGCTKENGKILAKVIDGLEHLRSLVLSLTNDDFGLRCCLESISSPPKYLQSLKLYSPLAELPNWISSLENLEKIYLRNTKLMGKIEAIEKLTNLKILYLMWNSFEVLKELCFGEGTFPMLKVMILEDIDELESVSIEKTALKSLELLKISECSSIRKGGVSGLDFLLQLKEMEVYGYVSRDREFVRNIQEQLKKLPKEPILKVHF